MFISESNSVAFNLPDSGTQVSRPLLECLSMLPGSPWERLDRVLINLVLLPF